MLINYTFNNFRSFKNKAALSMVAGKQRTFNENMIRQDGKRILPSWMHCFSDISFRCFRNEQIMIKEVYMIYLMRFVINEFEKNWKELLVAIYFIF